MIHASSLECSSTQPADSRDVRVAMTKYLCSFGAAMHEFLVRILGQSCFLGPDETSLLKLALVFTVNNYSIQGK